MPEVINWLRSYEFIAIWLEGIALVLIFIWDRLSMPIAREILQNVE